MVLWLHSTADTLPHPHAEQVQRYPKHRTVWVWQASFISRWGALEFDPCRHRAEKPKLTQTPRADGCNFQFIRSRCWLIVAFYGPLMMIR